MAFNIESIKRGTSNLPPRITIYGPPGIGKSTFAAGAPNPIFIQTEDGLAGIDVPHFPLAKKYEDVSQALKTLATEKHDFKTVVIDSIDWLENLLFNHIAQKSKKESIEDFGYGKGYVVASEEFQILLDALNYLREEKKLAIILIAHSQIKHFDDPRTESYDRFELKLHKRINSLLVEWSDVIAFADEHAHFTKEKETAKAKARGTGSRKLFLERSPAFEAKNRYALPPILDLDFSVFSNALIEQQNNKTKQQNKKRK